MPYGDHAVRTETEEPDFSLVRIANFLQEVQQGQWVTLAVAHWPCSLARSSIIPTHDFPNLNYIDILSRLFYAMPARFLW
jgi:hypothetical protein